MATESDPRVAPRFGVSMPYVADGREGQTRDLSATGLSFDSDTAYKVGAIVDLTLHYGLDGHNFPMDCQVEVVRVQPCDGRFTIAARWCKPFMGTAGDSALDQRHADRFGIAVPVTMDGGEGETLDISETGILFETSASSQPQVGSRVAMTLEYTLDGHEYHTRCDVEVVRVEQVGNRVNVATRLLSPLQAPQ